MAEGYTKSQRLLLEIARCPHVSHIRRGAKLVHPCAQLVRSQPIDKPLQLPEPWSGDIEHAPILFLSSNPSIAHCDCKDGVRCSGEEFPTEAASDATVIDFFSRRFAPPWACIPPKGPVKTLRHDGSYQAGGASTGGGPETGRHNCSSARRASGSTSP